jgi:putative phosphoesterase
MTTRALQVGLISDTHGLLRPEAFEALKGSDHIVHAGDICDPAILTQLEKIAPVTAVRGNNDLGPWASAIAETEMLQLAETTIYVIHDLGQLDLDPVAEGLHVVVSGHSHQPRAEVRGGVLFINPGSAGPRRFKLPVSVGRLAVSGVSVIPELIELKLS